METKETGMPMVQCTVKQLEDSLMYDDLMKEFDYKLSFIWLRKHKSEILKMIDNE